MTAAAGLTVPFALAAQRVRRRSLCRIPATSSAHPQHSRAHSFPQCHALQAPQQQRVVLRQPRVLPAMSSMCTCVRCTRAPATSVTAWPRCSCANEHPTGHDFRHSLRCCVHRCRRCTTRCSPSQSRGRERRRRAAVWTEESGRERRRGWKRKSARLTSISLCTDWALLCLIHFSLLFLLSLFLSFSSDHHWSSRLHSSLSLCVPLSPLYNPAASLRIKPTEESDLFEKEAFDAFLATPELADYSALELRDQINDFNASVLKLGRFCQQAAALPLPRDQTAAARRAEQERMEENELQKTLASMMTGKQTKFQQPAAATAAAAHAFSASAAAVNNQPMHSHAHQQQQQQQHQQYSSHPQQQQHHAQQQPRPIPQQQQPQQQYQSYLQ